VLEHNGLIVVLSLVIQGPLRLVLALLLNQNIRGRGLIRVLIFVPYVISEVIAGTGFSLMLQVNGAVNDALHNIGPAPSPPTGLLTRASRSGPLRASFTWKYVGFAVIFDAGRHAGDPDELSRGRAHRRRLLLAGPAPHRGAAARPTIRIWGFLSIIGALQLSTWSTSSGVSNISSTAGTSTMADELPIEPFKNGPASDGREKKFYGGINLDSAEFRQ